MKKTKPEYLAKAKRKYHAMSAADKEALLGRARERWRSLSAQEREDLKERRQLWRAKRRIQGIPVERERYLKKKYGLTAAAWDALFESQGRCCACCGSSDPRRKLEFGGWHTDHDHETGKIRGILCHRCNRLLGFLGDTEARVAASAEMYLAYLRSRP